MNFRKIININELLKKSNKKITISNFNNAIESLLNNEKFKNDFKNAWKDYYTKGMTPLMLKTQYGLTKEDDITESMINAEVVKAFKSEIEAFKSEAGENEEEIIHYIISRESDSLDPNRFFYIYLIEYFGGVVNNSKVEEYPKGWMDIYFKYQDIDKLFEWAYEQEYGEPFIRTYDMTPNEIREIKNKVLDKYLNLIGEIELPFEKEVKPYYTTFDHKLEKRDVENPEYYIEED